jgi:hypothetical protein
VHRLCTIQQPVHNCVDNYVTNLWIPLRGLLVNTFVLTAESQQLLPKSGTVYDTVRERPY